MEHEKNEECPFKNRIDFHSIGRDNCQYHHEFECLCLGGIQGHIDPVVSANSRAI